MYRHTDQNPTILHNVPVKWDAIQDSSGVISEVYTVYCYTRKVISHNLVNVYKRLWKNIFFKWENSLFRSGHVQ